jgi:hypothetical protein
MHTARRTATRRTKPIVALLSQLIEQMKPSFIAQLFEKWTKGFRVDAEQKKKIDRIEDH